MNLKHISNQVTSETNKGRYHLDISQGVRKYKFQELKTGLSGRKCLRHYTNPSFQGTLSYYLYLPLNFFNFFFFYQWMTKEWVQPEIYYKIYKRRNYKNYINVILITELFFVAVGSSMSSYTLINNLVQSLNMYLHCICNKQ